MARDEAVTRIGAADLAWIDENATVYMQTAFGHDAVFILDMANNPIYAMSAGTRLAADRFAVDAATLMPLVKTWRRQVHGEAGRADLGVTDIVMVHGRPAMVRVKLVVPSTDKLSVAPGAENIHISVRTIDDRVLSALGKREQIERVHLDATPELRIDEGSYRLVSKAGTPLGWVVWRTERPGTTLILETAPARVSLFVLFAGFLLFLVVKLRAQDPAPLSRLQDQDRPQLRSQRRRLRAGPGARQGDGRRREAFDMQVVAEGVQTPLQRDRLVQLGCGQLQGFLFAEARRVEDLQRIIVGGGTAAEPLADASVA